MNKLVHTTPTTTTPPIHGEKKAGRTQFRLRKKMIHIKKGMMGVLGQETSDDFSSLYPSPEGSFSLCLTATQ